jgi:protein-disulfide isomerase
VALVFLAASAPAVAQRGFIGIDDDPQLGPSNAKVTILEFGDYQCPLCRQFWRETFPRIRKEYIETGRVRLIFRDFPLDNHPAAIPMALAAQCAADQGKYWEMHDKMYGEQDKRGRDVVRVNVGDIKRWATEVGLAAAAFNECFDSERHEPEVKKDFDDAVGVGMRGTPMFFINGRVIAGARPFAEFQKVIEEELAK